jgi:hypothetical protein
MNDGRLPSIIKTFEFIAESIQAARLVVDRRVDRRVVEHHDRYDYCQQGCTQALHLLSSRSDGILAGILLQPVCKCRGDLHCGKAESAPLLLSASMAETLLENLQFARKGHQCGANENVCRNVILDVLVLGEYRN